MQMWSVGVTLWQLACGIEPYHGMDAFQVAVQVASGTLQLPLDRTGGVWPDTAGICTTRWPDTSAAVCRQVLTACLAFQPDQRCNASDLMPILTQALQDVVEL
jgi:hypothetical protein